MKRIRTWDLDLISLIGIIAGIHLIMYLRAFGAQAIMDPRCMMLGMAAVCTAALGRETREYDERVARRESVTTLLNTFHRRGWIVVLGLSGYIVLASFLPASSFPIIPKENPHVDVAMRCFYGVLIVLTFLRQRSLRVRLSYPKE